MANQFLIKNTMAEIRAITTSEISDLQTNTYEGVLLLGYYTKGDTPAPISYYLSETLESDDGGSVIEVSGIKLEHRFVGEIDVSYFGASESVNDNSILINNAIDYANANKVSTVVNTKELNCIVKDSTRYSGCIQLKSNITFNNSMGVIKISPTDLSNYAIIGGDAINNVRIIAGTIIGDKHSHLGTGEWGMGVALRDVHHFVIENGTIRECWGDGIYLFGDSSAPSVYSYGCIDGVIDRITCSDNRRNGTSVICCRNLVIRSSRFTNTSGTPPQAGLDIEPNTNQKCYNVTVENCTFEGNASMPMAITSHGVESATRFIGIVERVRVVSCNFYGDRVQVSQSTSVSKTVVKNIVFDKCSIDTINTYGINIANGVSDVTVQNCNISVANESGNPDALIVGIRFYNSNNCKALYNNIHSISATSGIILSEQSSNCIVRGNNIRGVYDWGVISGTGKHNIIEENYIVNTGYGGVLMYGKFNKVCKNEIFCITTGIRLDSSEDCNVNDNYLYTQESVSTAPNMALTGGSVRANVVGNKIYSSDTKDFSVYLESNPNNILNIFENNIVKGGITGMRLVGDKTKTSFNTVMDVIGRGIWLNGNMLQISGNVIVNTVLEALQITQSNHSSIRYNIFANIGAGFSENSGRVVYLNTNSVNTYILNNIIDNTELDKILPYAFDILPPTSLNNILIDNTVLGPFTTAIRNETGNKVLKDSTAKATLQVRGLVNQSASQANSSATDINTLVSEYNSLLAKLRAAGILAT